MPANTIRLNSGQTLYIEKLIQSQTYSFLLEGLPNNKLNNGIVDDLKTRGSSEPLTVTTFLLEPERRKDHRPPRDPDKALVAARLGLYTEWLPRISSIAVLYTIGGKLNDPTMDGKSLTLCFFQHTFGIEEATKLIQSVEWDRHAAEFRHWYS